MERMKYPEESIDEAARRLTDGHYVVPSVPGDNPDRDRTISEAIAKMKAERAENARS
ncbi:MULTISPECIES: hypothetical protein [Paenibacillus]|uniref:Uncharacterized protein n=2 Tax=Paenibacillus TaxID=44249 RepID=A0A919Y0A7_9BACL|nr:MULTISPECIES: hypothetical protein [Paenibacillus]GGG18197.1 hypothetical protein GCM10010913_45420 [Paenibacillus aceti]GIO42272.1 hypothetical protein J41TS4_20300 [Paenibacillus apis]